MGLGVRGRSVLVAAVLLSAVVDGNAFATAPNGARAADRRIATQASFVADDFPAGWRAERANTDDGKRTGEIIDQTNVCRALSKARRSALKTPGRTSQNFSRQDERYSSTIHVFKTDSAVDEIFKVYTSPGSQRCLSRVAEQLGVERAGDRADEVTINVAAAEVTGPTVGDESTHTELRITVEQEGLSFEQESFAEFLYVRVGRAMALYQYAHDFEGGTGSNMFGQLVDNSVRRLRAGLEGQPVIDADAPVPLGTEAAAGDGSRVTVFSYQQGLQHQFDFSPEEISAGPPGSVWAAADVQICAPENADDTFFASAFNFKLVFPDHTSADVAQSPIEPRIDSGAPAPGSCNRGFIGFAVPSDSAPTAVVYDAPSGRPLQWQPG
jgi:hypothetical protein